MSSFTAAAVGIHASHAISALGAGGAEHLAALANDDNYLSERDDLHLSLRVQCGAHNGELLPLPALLTPLASRNLQLAYTALAPLLPVLAQCAQTIPLQRLAIIVGTSTSGISDSEQLLAEQLRAGAQPALQHSRQRMSATAEALQLLLGWRGPCYTISTACSSSAKALAAGQRLLNADLADAVLVGGVDSLASLTVNGFGSLECLSPAQCTPCGASRDGINIGEAAAWFLLKKQPAPVMLLGAGESMDAWHISAPHPDGIGAASAMQRALQHAACSAADIDYINLHGTGTPQNDAMEIAAVKKVFGDSAPALSSTKHKTGHCLGAAGAIEAFICEQLLRSKSPLPLHCAAPLDAALLGVDYVRTLQAARPVRRVMSNSFAFGGSNISLIFGTEA